MHGGDRLKPALAPTLTVTQIMPHPGAGALYENPAPYCDPLLDTPHHPTTARIDLAALRRNIATVRSHLAPGVQVLAMIKANAYGHGMIPVATAAAAAGIGFFGIARVEEGLELRRAGFEQRILLLELASGDRAMTAIRLGLEITVASLAQAEELGDLARRLGAKARLHVEVDTGMGRIGVDYRDATDVVEAISRLPDSELTGVFSHFASSDDPDQAFAREQLERFNGVLAELKNRGVRIPLRHFANSGAVMTLPESHFDLVRVGIMLYGYAPGRAIAAPELTPVMSLQSRVSFVKTVAAGTPISYDRRYVTKEDTRIATVLAGYGDGFSRRQTNNAQVLIRGRRHPVVGTVCMDMIMVDLGFDSDVCAGDVVTLIGRDGTEVITAWDVAARLDTIPYEVTCQVAERVPRVFVHGACGADAPARPAPL